MPLSNFKISLKELKKVDKWMIISIILITSFGIVNIYLAKKTTAYQSKTKNKKRARNSI